MKRKPHRKQDKTFSGHHFSPAPPDCAILYLARTKTVLEQVRPEDGAHILRRVLRVDFNKCVRVIREYARSGGTAEKDQPHPGE